MASFSYIATDSQGKSINSTVDADDKSKAIQAIRRQGFTPISVKDAKVSNISSLGSISFLTSKKVKNDDLVMFTRQLSAMVSAGVPIIRALTSQKDHTDSKALETILTATISDVEGGSSLADSLEKHPGTFSDVYVNMVRSGETAGILDEVLKRLAMQQEKSSAMRKKIKSAMTYPTVLMVITIGAFFGLMIFVIPQIGGIVKDLGGPDAQLPPLTKAMLGISSFLIHKGVFLVPVIVAAVIGIMRWLKTPKGKRFFHTTVLKVPVIKTLIQKVAVARFARTFSSLMGAGVAVLEALSVTSRAIGNVVYEDSLKNAAEQVKNGKSLSSVIEADPLFPPIVAQMLSVGEETGQTDVVLLKVADFYEEEVDVAIDGASSIIEPIMILIMGTMVGLIAASVMGPIAGLAQTVKS